MPKLYAISDLHLNHPTNWQAWQALPHYPDDWLIVAGDVSETLVRFAQAMGLLSQRFAKVFWTPGNHDLWTIPQKQPTELRGVAKYQKLVELCRAFGVVTPEDPYVVWPYGDPYVIAPTFTLYDYSFAPEGMDRQTAVAWAEERNTVATDEYLLHADPYPSAQDWCAQRCLYTERRLAGLSNPIILVNHYPILRELAVLPRVPRFVIWCGTMRTQEWVHKYNLHSVIYGHLHIRRSDRRHNTRFEEVSIGYPRNWTQSKGVSHYLRVILEGN